MSEQKKECVNCPGATDHDTAHCPFVRSYEGDLVRAEPGTQETLAAFHHPSGGFVANAEGLVNIVTPPYPIKRLVFPRGMVADFTNAPDEVVVREQPNKVPIIDIQRCTFKGKNEDGSLPLDYSGKVKMHGWTCYGPLQDEQVEGAQGEREIAGWRERILAEHPLSDPGYWPDALLVEHMTAEIADLRAALAQPSPEPDHFAHSDKKLEALLNATALVIESPGHDAAHYWAECMREYDEAHSPAPELASFQPWEAENIAFVLRNIGALEAEDIDGDNVDLRFEDANGRDTGCDVSIVEYAEKAADLIEAMLRIAPVAQAGQVPEGFALAPTRMILDKETIESIAFHCGDGGGSYGDYQDGLLFIGDIRDDDGRMVHGLHLACSECEEEGYTTLVEFAAAPAQGGE